MVVRPWVSWIRSQAILLPAPEKDSSKRQECRGWRWRPSCCCNEFNLEQQVIPVSSWALWHTHNRKHHFWVVFCPVFWLHGVGRRQQVQQSRRTNPHWSHQASSQIELSKMSSTKPSDGKSKRLKKLKSNPIKLTIDDALGKGRGLYESCFWQCLFFLH